MPGNKQEIDVRLGESKEINIPLAPGKEKPEVRPQKSSLKDSQSDAIENEDNNQEEKREQDGESEAPSQEGESGVKNQSSDQKSELGPVGEMNKRPDRRPDLNKGFLNSEGINKTKEQLQKRRQEQKDEDLNNIQENASERLGFNKKNNINPEEDSTEEKNNSENEIDNKDENAENQSSDQKSELGPVGEMNKRPDRRKKEKEDKGEGKERNSKEGSPLASSWRKLRNSLSKKKKKNSAKEQVEEAINKTSRLASYELYRQCWLNLIDSFGLTYFGLLFLFIGRYVLFSPKFVKFVSITDESERIKIIQNKEVTSIGMMITFLSVTAAIVVLIFLIIILVSLVIKAMNLTWWGLIINPEQFFSDLNDIYEFVKALL